MIRVSIGISTYHTGENLIHTLRSIYNQTSFKFIDRILLITDGSIISHKIIQQIKNPKLKILVKRKRKGQSTRINDILSFLQSELVLLVNDDIVLKKNAVEKMLLTYQKYRPNLISGRVEPLPGNSLMEKTLGISNLINTFIIKHWNRGDNYLACNGRFLGIEHSLARKIKIPKKMFNNDAFLYIFTKSHNYKFRYVDDAVCFYKNPTNLQEHLNQSIRFQNSYHENQKHFGKNIDSYYNLPYKIKIQALFKLISSNLFYVLSYSFLFLYTRVTMLLTKNVVLRKNRKGYWQTDRSTKNLKIV